MMYILINYLRNGFHSQTIQTITLLLFEKRYLDKQHDVQNHCYSILQKRQILGTGSVFYKVANAKVNQFWFPAHINCNIYSINSEPNALCAQMKCHIYFDFFPLDHSAYGTCSLIPFSPTLMLILYHQAYNPLHLFLIISPIVQNIQTIQGYCIKKDSVYV